MRRKGTPGGKTPRKRTWRTSSPTRCRTARCFRWTACGRGAGGGGAPPGATPRRAGREGSPPIVPVGGRFPFRGGGGEGGPARGGPPEVPRDRGERGASGDRGARPVPGGMDIGGGRRPGGGDRGVREACGGPGRAGAPGVGVPACLRALPAETVRRGDQGVRGGGEIGDVSGGAGAARVLEGEGPHRVRREAEGG